MKNERQHTLDQELLSAYLDGELRQAERQAFETRLQQEPELQNRLENLRRTKLTVGYLPRLHAPRNYTLTPDMVTVRRPRQAPIFTTLRLASALAALLLVALIGVEFLFTSGPLARPQLGAKPMMEAAMVADDASLEPLILWGVPGAGGYGSDEPVVGYGGGGEAAMVEEPVMVESMPVESELPVEEEILAEEAPEIMLEAEILPPDAETAEMPQSPSSDQKELPILGINPDESGEIISRSSDSAPSAVPQPVWRLIVRWLQITLGAVVVVGGLSLLLLHVRRSAV